MSAEKIITHDDLDALQDIRELAAVRSWPRSCALLDRLIAAAEADAPPLPEGWHLWDNPVATADDRDRLTPLRPTVTESAEDEHLAVACDWSDYRRDYGVSPDPEVMRREHRAFTAGWKAGRHGDQSGVLR